MYGLLTLTDNQIKKQWYVVHTYSGHESRVKEQIQKRILIKEMKKYFGDIIIPSEEVIEMKFGKKRKSKRKFFPGYVLVEMNMKEDLWYLIKKIPGVLGFIGGSSEKPIPISSKEIKHILSIPFFYVKRLINIKKITKKNLKIPYLLGESFK